MNPIVSRIRNTIITPKAVLPVRPSVLAHGKRNTTSISKIRKRIATI